MRLNVRGGVAGSVVEGLARRMEREGIGVGCGIVGGCFGW